MEQIIKKYIQYLKDGQNRKHASEDEVWKILEEKIDYSGSQKKRKSTMRYCIISGVAASLFAAVFIGCLVLRTNESNTHEIAAISVNNSSEHIKVISSSGENVELISDNINYTHKVTEATSATSGKPEKTPTETLITPGGRICKLVLPDGSIIHVNANSSVTYPKVFAKNERRIRVEGEVFCEVEHAREIPFYVETKDFTVRVLGTKFNVSAYKSNEKSNVVLVSGEVQLTGKGEDMKLKPRQMALFDNEKFISLRNVETSRYTSWTEGYLILKSEPLHVIFEKIEEFYGVNIKCDPSIEKELYTGKLDLTGRVEDILDLIQFTVPVKYEMKNDFYQITKK